ncbi:MAG: fumarylacetoacetate hydrolase family protein [Peptococcaceae bacterium]|nr:fumarylacetoacetate hydrolase family protein [Peptococcaceae bacterium]
MKFARVATDGQIYYGIVEGDTIQLIDGDPFGDLHLSRTSLPLADCQLLAPVRPRHVYAVGLNYHAHIDEFKHIDPTRAATEAPITFLCAETAICGPSDDIILDSRTDEIHYEGELVAIIGKTCRSVSAADALNYVLGYTIGNDVSNRTQQRADKQWLRAKSHPTYKPLGPIIATDIPDPQQLHVTTTVNGELRQQGNTSQMIFPVASLIAHISSFTTLQPGDVIYTGTPAGVGPLHAGDTVSITIEGIGTLTNTAKYIEGKE